MSRTLYALPVALAVMATSPMQAGQKGGAVVRMPSDAPAA